MFPSDINNHQVLHEARQCELEAAAQHNRQVKALTQNGDVSRLRQRIGSMLIELGQKVAQEPKRDVRLVFSARH